ncbi:hypothetical protein SO802_034036 [Lithocarpus litseifolius]|uniref:Cucumisin n=1 Tax=Lithocarpus litseifolius TaxID=425828 RepID=A0AAW2BEU9_9ROSI
MPFTTTSSNDQQHMVYSYHNVATGFAARLTEEEVKAMEGKDGFISAHPERILPLHTTHSPNFLGDEGVPPPPAKWKGKCEFNGTLCNNKIIGARLFQNGGEPVGTPPFDDVGHGTHTANTAAGNFIENVNALGNANGTAVGMAPLAHLAIYKVCSEQGCLESNKLAALDTAIEDGVDVLSLSLGGFTAPFYEDSIALGAFTTIQKGILVSCSAANGGPFYGSLSNEAPWILTVGASTINRSIRATAKVQMAINHLLSASQGTKIRSYINSTSALTATIVFKGTIIGDLSTLTVASFSFSGPSQTSPGILKPDIIRPGENILVAWPVPLDNRTVSNLTFNVLSGTSMSCPHLSGIAALLESSNPDWSPTAIKSAIVTIANVLNLGGKPILDQRLLPADIFATGAGHANPSKANNAGLVYNIQPDDYIPYLCGLNYTDKQVGVIVQHKVNCSEVTSIAESQLNYPSFSIILGFDTQAYSRIVTNVGQANSSYILEIVAPQGVGISVNPQQITFTGIKQKATYSGIPPNRQGC